jgi:hypothetical protein
MRDSNRLFRDFNKVIGLDLGRPKETNTSTLRCESCQALATGVGGHGWRQKVVRV